jgi:hypothetical protein
MTVNLSLCSPNGSEVAYLVVVTTTLCVESTVEVAVTMVLMATVFDVVLVMRGTEMKLEQKAVAFCSLRRLTILFTSRQKAGGAAKTPEAPSSNAVVVLKRMVNSHSKDKQFQFFSRPREPLEPITTLLPRHPLASQQYKYSINAVWRDCRRRRPELNSLQRTAHFSRLLRIRYLGTQAPL